MLNWKKLGKALLAAVGFLGGLALFVGGLAALPLLAPPALGFGVIILGALGLITYTLYKDETWR